MKIGDKPMTKEKRQETDGIQFGNGHGNLWQIRITGLDTLRLSKICVVLVCDEC